VNTMIRCQVRWKELQAMASATAEKARAMGEAFVTFLIEMGCEAAQASLFAATPTDVVWFFMEKDTAGRTVVHAKECPYLRQGSSWAGRLCNCPRRLKASTLDSAIGTLRGVFRDLGRTGPWCYRTHTGNPCDSREVQAFLKWSDKEQLQGGVETKRAALFDVEVFQKLQKQVLSGWVRAKMGQPHETILAARDALFYSTMWTTGLRATDCLRLLSQGIEWFESPGSRYKAGWYLHIGGSKTEKKARQARMFRLWDDSSMYSPMRAYAGYVEALAAVGLALQPGYLFRNVVGKEDGSFGWGAQTTYSDVNGRFRKWADKVGIPSSVTLHSFHGSHAANESAEGTPRAEVCTEMAWQESTRAYYVDGRQVLGLEGLITTVARKKGTS
jgi:integrase